MVPILLYTNDTWGIDIPVYRYTDNISSLYFLDLSPHVKVRGTIRIDPEMEGNASNNFKRL